jgi:hypothetical protein
MHAATSKVENSGQGLSCQLKFVHDTGYNTGTVGYSKHHLVPLWGGGIISAAYLFLFIMYILVVHGSWSLMPKQVWLSLFTKSNIFLLIPSFLSGAPFSATQFNKHSSLLLLWQSLALAVSLFFFCRLYSLCEQGQGILTEGEGSVRLTSSLW